MNCRMVTVTTLHVSSSHHQIADYYPVTACSQMFRGPKFTNIPKYPKVLAFYFSSRPPDKSCLTIKA